MATEEKAERKSPIDLSVVADYFLIAASAACAGYGASNFWIGASVLFGLIAIYKPER
ncbi:hypothetical protein [Paraburkholderia sp. GAS32]|uniref:hypothetical protein n=1 Tax=Paraburkholderia sp. GAS32 TaxID=3035129 RepID=UPI003D202E92